MINDQPLAHRGPGGNLRARENGAEVAYQYGKRAHVMQMKPSGSPVQQDSVKTGMKQYHPQLHQNSGLMARKLTNIRPDVLKHDISDPPL